MQAVGDAFIWGPNGVGALFGVIQLVLIAVFPKGKCLARIWLD